MVTLAVDGIDLFKIAGRSISGWVPSFKMSTATPVKQPFCSQLEERLIIMNISSLSPLADLIREHSLFRAIDP